MSKRYTEGIAFDGAAILDNGVPIKITEILNRLNRLNDLENDSQKSSGLPSIIITKRSEVADISNPCRECGNEVEDPDNFTICMMCYNLEMSE